MSMRKESMLRSQVPKTPPGSGKMRSTTVPRVINKEKRELAPLTASDKMLVAFRKVLVKMSVDDPDGSRFHISGTLLRVIDQPSEQTVKEGEFASYSGSGYAKLGVSLKNGMMSYRYVHFVINFKDCLNDNGLPDVEFFDPTEVDDVGLHHPEVIGL